MVVLWNNCFADILLQSPFFWDRTWKGNSTISGLLPRAMEIFAWGYCKVVVSSCNFEGQANRWNLAIWHQMAYLKWKYSIILGMYIVQVCAVLNQFLILMLFIVRVSRKCSERFNTIYSWWEDICFDASLENDS